MLTWGNNFVFILRITLLLTTVQVYYRFIPLFFISLTHTRTTVEVNVDSGIEYHLVGLPDNAIKERNYRIAAALQNNGYKIPGKKITINMAPADLRKEGSAYDLTLAIGILTASKQIKADNLKDFLIMGELSLDGSLQSIRGALPIAVKAREEGFKGFILPSQNAKEAAMGNV